MRGRIWGARKRRPAASPASPASPARKALARLRIRLTIAYTLITVVGLAVLSAVAIKTDADSRRTGEFEALQRRVAVVRSLIYYEDGRLRLDGLADDDATDGGLPVLVLATQPDGTLRPLFTAGHPGVAPARLRAVADDALGSDDVATAEGRDDAGRARYFLAAPFYQDGTTHQVGVVAAVGDPARGAAAHRRLVAALLVGCAALTAAGAALGYLLARRSMRPAWQAQEQQERLLADAAHELRTPVAVIRGAVDLANDAPGALAEHLPRIGTASHRLADVVEHLLTRARLQAGVHQPRLEALRLDQLVETVCAELPPGAHRVQLDLADSVVSADAGLVRAAVRNLLDNAVRHGAGTPGAGDAEITVSVRGPVVTVADRGPGVAAADVPRVFERFQSPGGSTGIGLSLTQWVADAHGGDIRVEQRPGGGAVFVLRLAPGERVRGRVRSRIPHGRARTM
ncbi:sensor histidine kinase [Embleya sp. AB8]|uniref:sensor histidine kinase n=1 Tax=Embleya sp. AB8 TaxID=3156304 RepID=UPI003C7584A7